ncbi:helix-turn-helix domain-containing protein [Galbitalea sp. SE-J8]|uniref:helix-turn-helix domain-containing protein n=1 Tax=Galbitalea sp. SE-J8 TaxID=3054952 RepID=UPI00259D2E95|nr:helix-turn-helix domain-containing protein [Galbitalea sp. SE-J8]MDM4761678.1 helix-turn-helix domain-containing protein [Galbitalea sp. SE-J8]
MTTEPADVPERRIVDLEGLKALAHPLRVQIVDALSTYGPATASGLAERLGESSGATSYHLRQLARHGFVREVEGRGTARERWWERSPGSFQFGDAETRKSPAGREATKLVSREMISSRERHLRAYIDRADRELDGGWLDAGGLSLVNLRLTAEQLTEATEALEAVMDGFVARWRGQDLPGSRPVQFQINAIPVMDGDVTPDPEEKS